MNWRSIKDDGYPTKEGLGYLVSDGRLIEFSDWVDKTWVGGSVYATYEEVSGTSFDFVVTHWLPCEELELPEKEYKCTCNSAYAMNGCNIKCDSKIKR